ncbi:hypothetical protein U1Q18_051094, partial [Sarracenia purpurea var. burkii]
ENQHTRLKIRRIAQEPSVTTNRFGRRIDVIFQESQSFPPNGLTVPWQPSFGGRKPSSMIKTPSPRCIRALSPPEREVALSAFSKRHQI